MAAVVLGADRGDVSDWKLIPTRADRRVGIRSRACGINISGDGTASRIWSSGSTVRVRFADGRSSGNGDSSLPEIRVQSVCPSADELNDGRPSTGHESTVRVAPETARNTSSSASVGAIADEWTMGTVNDGQVRRGVGDDDGQPVSEPVAAPYSSDGDFSTTATTSSSVTDGNLVD